jgi:hypothetical protein
MATRRIGYRSRLLFFLIVPAFAAGMFFGYTSGSRNVEEKVFTAGYDAAMNHVRQTIETKTAGLDSFYMSDLGIKFIPRGNNILGIKYVGSGLGADTVGAKTVLEARR